MSSFLRRSQEGEDRMHRMVFVTPGGREISAFLDLAATERVARVRAGIEEVEETHRPTWSEKLWGMLEAMLTEHKGGVR
jgi:DNA-binding MarR family transcriptional regulator